MISKSDRKEIFERCKYCQFVSKWELEVKYKASPDELKEIMTQLQKRFIEIFDEEKRNIMRRLKVQPQLQPKPYAWGLSLDMCCEFNLWEPPIFKVDTNTGVAFLVGLPVYVSGYGFYIEGKPIPPIWDQIEVANDVYGELLREASLKHMVGLKEAKEFY